MILFGYILKNFLKLAFGVIFLAVGLFVVFDFMHKSTTYFDRTKPETINLIRFYLAHMPFQIYLYLPIGSLLASTFLALSLGKNQEINAMRASGASLKRIAAPFFFGGMLLTALGFFLTERMVPLSFRYLRYVKKVLIEKQNSVPEKNTLSWLHYGNQFYYLKDYNSQKKTMGSLEVFVLSQSFLPLKRLFGEPVEYDGAHNSWKLSNWEETYFHPDFPAQLSEIKKGQNKWVNIPIPIQTIPNEIKQPEELTLAEMALAISRDQHYGGDILSFETAWHMRLAYLLSALFLSLMGVPFGFASQRQGEQFQRLAFAFLFGFSYWFIVASSKTVALSGVLPPFVCAWTGVVFVLCVLFFQFLRIENL